MMPSTLLDRNKDPTLARLVLLNGDDIIFTKESFFSEPTKKKLFLWHLAFRKGILLTVLPLLADSLMSTVLRKWSKLIYYYECILRQFCFLTCLISGALLVFLLLTKLRKWMLRWLTSIQDPNNRQDEPRIFLVLCFQCCYSSLEKNSLSSQNCTLCSPQIVHLVQNLFIIVQTLFIIVQRFFLLSLICEMLKL